MKPIALLISLLLMLVTSDSTAQIAVVVSAKSAVNSLTKEQTAALFLGKSFNLPGAGLPALIDLPESAPTRELFYKKLTGKSTADVKGLWMRMVFSGKGVPPTEVANSAEVKKLLLSNNDAIGYIEKSAVDASMKVLFILD